jgi:hypothetical protein
VDVDQPDARGRLFTARVERVRAQYSFSSRSFLRAIVQYLDTQSDTALYPNGVDPRTGGVSTSLLFAYKVNWQTVLFLGWGDDQERDTATPGDPMRPQTRGLFAKISYAFQR